jgi:hypothetical protein
MDPPPKNYEIPRATAVRARCASSLPVKYTVLVERIVKLGYSNMYWYCSLLSNWALHHKFNFTIPEYKLLDTSAAGPAS